MHTQAHQSEEFLKSTISNLSSEMQECISNCTACHHICLFTLEHCLKKGGKHSEYSHISALVDCAALCAQSSNFMVRESSLHHGVCGVCAEACKICAESCERIGEDDQVMKQCAEMCRVCAESCRKMSAH